MCSTWSLLVPLGFKMLLFQDSKPAHWKMIVNWSQDASLCVITYLKHLGWSEEDYSDVNDHLQHICRLHNLLRGEAFTCEPTAVHANVDLTRMAVMMTIVGWCWWNKNTKCPIDAHCHRHRRKDLRFTKDCIEFTMNSRCFWKIFGLSDFLASSAFLIVMAASCFSVPLILAWLLSLSPDLASDCKHWAPSSWWDHVSSLPPF